MTEKTAQKEPGKKPAPSKKPKPQQEVVVQISLSELHPFPDHPFQVREDAKAQASEKRGEIKIRKHAAVIEGHILPDRKKRRH